MQICGELDKLLSYHAIQAVPCIGGQSRENDVRLIRQREPHIIVGTPGRILDHLEASQNFHLLFEEMQLLVLDEADTLFDRSLREKTQMILHYLPTRRQNLMFSATVGEE